MIVIKTKCRWSDADRMAAYLIKNLRNSVHYILNESARHFNRTVYFYSLLLITSNRALADESVSNTSSSDSQG